MRPLAALFVSAYLVTISAAHGQEPPALDVHLPLYPLPWACPPATVLTAGDVNADGISDLICLDRNAGVSPQVTIWMGKGGGEYTLGSRFSLTMSGVSATQLMDLNNDGYPDLLVRGATLKIYLNQGDGSFGDEQTPVDACTAFAVADFNRDGIMDVAVQRQQEVIIFLGSRDGTFTRGSTIANGTHSFLAAVDWNRDGIPDLFGYVQGTSAQPAVFEVWLGIGDGDFQIAPKGNVPCQGPPVLTDFTGDGEPDMVCANDGEVLIFPGDGRKGVGAAVARFPTGVRATSLQFRDVNGDGLDDMILPGEEAFSSSASPDMAAVLLRDSTGGFGPPHLFTADAFRVVVADYNQDGARDLITECCVLAGLGDGSFQAPVVTRVPGHSGAATAIAADLDGNGTMDLLIAADSGMLFMPGLGDGTFGVPKDLGTRSSSRLALQDFDGDGVPDLMINDSGQLYLRKGNGDGTFQPERRVTDGTGVGFPIFADVNNDGVPDAIYNSGALIMIRYGQKEDIFQTPSMITIGTVLDAADYTGDGNVDLVVAVSSYVVLFIGRGDGTFREGNRSQLFGFAIDTTSFNSYGIVAGDLNQDGYRDLIVGRITLLNNRDGSLTPIRGAPPKNSLIQDVTGDGVPDVLSVPTAVYPGLGDGNLGPPLLFGFQNVATVTAVADFNGDGRPDFALLLPNPLRVVTLLSR